MHIQPHIINPAVDQASCPQGTGEVAAVVTALSEEDPGHLKWVTCIF